MSDSYSAGDEVLYASPPIAEQRTALASDTAVNPKHAVGRGKPGMECAPSTAAYWWAYVHEIGARNYGAFNWRATPVNTSVYVEAAKRHIDLMASGEFFDPADGSPHAANAMACMAIVIDAYYHGTLVDDLGADPAELRKVMNEITSQRIRHELPGRDPLSARQDRPAGDVERKSAD